MPVATGCVVRGALGSGNARAASRVRADACRDVRLWSTGTAPVIMRVVHDTHAAAAFEADQSPLRAWLMDSDPALRWQVMQDLLGEPDDAVAAVRARVATRGWGGRLLATQDADGLWAGALYSPKWTSTTYTLLLLERLGLPSSHPQGRAACRALWQAARSYGGGLTLARTVREPESCITGMLVKLAAAFGLDDQRVDAAVRWLLDQQLDDGGWNCESIRRGSVHGSFHTSITVLEALLAYRDAGGGVRVDQSMEAGRLFFLAHRLYRSHRTGAVVDPAFTRFPFPPQWHFDIVRGLEYFRAVGAYRDEPLSDAIDEVRRRRRSDGTWPWYRPYSGRYWFQLEARGPSRWSTLRGLRVLQWWGDARAGLA